MTLLGKELGCFFFVDLVVMVVVLPSSLLPASLEDRFRLVAGRFLTGMVMVILMTAMTSRRVWREGFRLIRSDLRTKQYLADLCVVTVAKIPIDMHSFPD